MTSGGTAAEQRHLDPLWRPLQLAGVTVPNRIMTSAMTLQYGIDNRISDRHVAFYRERALGGVGLVFSEQLAASPLSPSPFPQALEVHTHEGAAGFARIVAALADTETRFFAQLFAAGACGSSTVGIAGWGPVRAPSAVGFPGGERPLPLEADEIGQIVADFARSAVNVKAAGCHGVEIHGAHGWLVGEFLSPFYNRRDDAYGGSVAARCRFAVEIGRAIRDAVGPDYPVGLSLSYDELIGPAGITPEDTLAQVEVLAAAGIFDFFDLSIGSAHAEHHTLAPMDVAEGFALPFAGRARALLGGRAAILVSGRVTGIAMAADAVKRGDADMVAMSRAHLADPHLVRKAREGRSRDITRCIGANVCVKRALGGDAVLCVVNPETGREADRPRRPPAARRSVLVIGAGPAGLTLAGRAAEAGHAVAVHERETDPGGHLHLLAALPGRNGWQLAVDDMVHRLRTAGGVLHLASSLSAADVAARGPELVILATGAAWERTGASVRVPGRDGVPGAEAAHVLGFDEAMRRSAVDPRSLGARVVIHDETGGIAPLALAERLGQGGTEVYLVTPRASVGEMAVMTHELPHIMPRLRGLGVRVVADHRVDAIRSDAVTLGDTWDGEPRMLTGVDTVVFAVERRPRLALFEALRAVGVPARRIGDALAPRETMAVIEEAHRLGGLFDRDAILADHGST